MIGAPFGMVVPAISMSSRAVRVGQNWTDDSKRRNSSTPGTISSGRRRSFSRASELSSQEAEIQRIVAGLLDNLKGKTRIDAVDEFAYPLRVSVICAILGVPREDEPRFHAWIQAFMNGLDLGPEAATEEQQRLRQLGDQGREDLRTYMAALLEKYAKQPGQGMLSA